jgi:Protein kinase domain/PEGA domain
MENPDPRNPPDSDDPEGDDEVALAIVEGRKEELDPETTGRCVDLVEQLEGVRSIMSALDHLGVGPDAPLKPPPFTSWGPFLLKEEIGRGAFGVVCRAYDPATERDIAVKLYRTVPDTDVKLPDEPRLMGQVRHPNVVSIYGAALHDGKPGIWMEYVRGRSLADRVRAEGPLPVGAALQIGIDLCGALTAVHGAGLVHQDVKPHNVMEEDARIVLMDFGAGMRDTDPAGRFMGTPLYMAPEVIRGGTPSVQSDVYSAGVLVFYLLTGTYPIYGTSAREIRQLHERFEASRARFDVALRNLRPDVGLEMSRCVARALAPPGERYLVAADFRRALESARRRSAGQWKRRAFYLGAAGLAAIFVLTRQRAPMTPEPLETRDRAARTRTVEPRPIESATQAEPVARVPGPGSTAVLAARSLRTRTPAAPTTTLAPPSPATGVAIDARTAATPTGTAAIAGGSLRLSAAPWAEVELDGTSLGLTPPLAVMSASSGVHQVCLVHPSYERFCRKVLVREGETSALRVDLSREAFPK